MTILLSVTAALILGQWLLGRRARADAARRWKPAEEWDGADVDRWLALIEPFPLRKPTHNKRL